MVFRGEGWSIWRKEMSVWGQRSPGVPSPLLRSALRYGPAREPALQPQDHTPASVCPSAGAKNHKGKEENLYIYNIKSLGD